VLLQRSLDLAARRGLEGTPSRVERWREERERRSQRRLHLLYSHSGESQRLAAGLAKEGHGLRGKDDERPRKLIRRRDRSRAREGLASRSSLR
jgi:hypothetical protein